MAYINQSRNARLKKRRGQGDGYINQSAPDDKNRGGIGAGLGYLAANLGLGAAGVGEGIGDLLAAGGDLLRGDTEMAKYRFLDNKTADAQRKLQESYNPGTIMKGAGDVASGIGNSLIFLIPYAGPYLAGAGYMGMGVSNAAEQTGDVGLKELGYGAVSGGLEFALDKFTGGIGKAGKNIGSAVSRKLGREAVESTAKATGRSASKLATKLTGKSLGKAVAIETAKGALGEAAEEALAEAIDPTLLNLFHIDENARFDIKNVAYAGLIGGLSGGLMTAGPAAINYKSAAKAGRAIRESGETADFLEHTRLVLGSAAKKKTRLNQETERKTEVPADAGRIKKAATAVSDFAAHRKASKTASGVDKLVDTIGKNLKTYESYLQKADKTEKELEISDAVLGELRGNVFLLENAALLEVYEDAILELDDEDKAEIVGRANTMAKEQGRKRFDYTVEDLNNNTDDILTFAASNYMLTDGYGRYLRKAAKPAEQTATPAEPTESPVEPAQAPETATDEQQAIPETEPVQREYEGDERTLRESAKGLGLSDVETDMMVNTYKYGSAMDADTFSKAFAEGVYYGRQNRRAEDVSKNTLLGTMSESERSAAIEAGRIGARADTERRAALAAQKTAPAPMVSNRVRLDLKDGVPLHQRGDREYAVYNASKIIGSALNADVVIHDTLGEKNGHKLNGYFNRKDNTIHVALDAGKDGNGTALYTLAHEATHYVREWSPEKYQVLSEFIGQHMSARGEDLDDMIAAKKELLRSMKEFKDLSDSALTDAAHEEVIADAMETVLSDGKVLQELAARDKSLWEKVKAWIREAIARLKAAYAELKPNSQAAKVLKETMTSMEEIERLFAEGVTAAGERAKGAEMVKDSKDNSGIVYHLRDALRTLGEYDATRKRHIESSGKDRIVRNYDEIRAFIQYSPSQKEFERIHIGIINPKTANLVMQKTKQNIDGYDVVLSNEFIAHIFHDHGDQRKETPRHQIAVTTANVEDLVEAMIDPDDVKAVEADTGPALRFEKSVGNKNVALTITSKKKGTLTLKSAWIIENSGGRTPSSNADALEETSETNGRSSAESSIPQPSDSVNSKFSISEENVSEENVSEDTAEAPETAADTNVGDKEVERLEAEEVFEGEILPRPTTPFRRALVDMLETMIETDAEYKILSSYAKKIGRLDAIQDQISQLNAKQEELRDILYTSPDAEERSKASKDLKELYEKRDQLAKIMAQGDREITRMHELAPVKNLMRQIDKSSKQKYKEEFKEREKARADSREVTTRRRAAIRVLGQLGTMLYKPTKARHVPSDMESLVSTVLRSADTKQFAKNRDHLRQMSELAVEIERLERKAALTGEEQDRLNKMKSKFEILEADTLSVKRQADVLLNAFKAYQKVAVEGIDKNLMVALEDDVRVIEEGTLAEMNLASLRAVEHFYKTLFHQINTENEAFATAKAERIDNMSTKANDEVQSSKPIAAFSPTGKEWKAMAGIRKFLWLNMKPLTVFEVIGSPKLQELFNNILDGEETWIKDVMEAKEHLDKAKKEYGYNKWDLTKRTEIKTANGEKVSLTLGEMMSLYAYMFRDQAEQHLSEGGFTFAPDATTIENFRDGKIKYEAVLNDQKQYKMRREDIAVMSDLLTEEQKQFAREVQQYLTSLGAKGNEVSKKLYGMELFKEEAYFPIKSNRDYLATSTGKSGDPNIKDRGTFKETTPNAGNPIVLEDFMKVVSGHVNTMATYHAFVLPVEDFTRVWNYRPVNIKKDAEGNAILDEHGNPIADSDASREYNSLKAEIASKYGHEANDYILQMLRDLNGGARSDATASILDKGITGFKRAATGMSMSTIIQQPTSILRAMAYVDHKYFRGAKRVPWDKVMKLAPVAAIKEIGGHDTGTGARTDDYLNAREYDSKGEKLKAALTPKAYGGDPKARDDYFGYLPAMADKIAWQYMFGAVLNEQADKLGKPIDSKEVEEAAAKRFTEVVRRTQVYDSTLTRTQLMRSKDRLWKIVTAFGAEPATVLSMMADGWVKYQRGDKKFFRDTGAAVAMSIIATAAASSLIYAMRDDDEEETYSEKYVESLTSELIEGFNPAEYVPIARDVASLFKGYEIERTDMALVGNLLEQVEMITSSKRSVPDKIFGVTGAVSAFFGVPVTNVYRDVKGLYKTTTGLMSAEEQTASGYRHAAGDAVRGQFNLLSKMFGAESGNAYELYTAYVKGDKAHYDRVSKRYESPEAVEQALRKELRENDKRIAEAAEARMNGELDVYESIVEQIDGEGIFDRNIVIRAVNNEISAMKATAERGGLAPKAEAEEEPTPESIYQTSDLNAALERGDAEDFTWIYHTLMAYKQEQGKTEAQARSSIKSSLTTYWKKRYTAAWEENNSAEMKRILQILLSTGLYGSHNDTATTLEGWVKAYAKDKRK